MARSRATVDLAESGAINPNVRSLTSINPDSEMIPVARSNGILTTLTVPEGGIISGQSAVSADGRLDSGRDDPAFARGDASALARN